MMKMVLKKQTQSLRICCRKSELTLLVPPCRNLLRIWTAHSGCRFLTTEARKQDSRTEEQKDSRRAPYPNNDRFCIIIHKVRFSSDIVETKKWNRKGILPKYLILVEVLLQAPGELSRRFGIAPERLLDDNSSPSVWRRCSEACATHHIDKYIWWYR